MFGLGGTEIVVGFLILDMIVMIGVAYWIVSRRNQNNSGNNQQNTFSNPSAASPWSSSPFEDKAAFDDDEVRQLIQQRQKIQAIKLVRERTGLGLKEAKDAVEELERRMR